MIDSESVTIIRECFHFHYKRTFKYYVINFGERRGVLTKDTDHADIEDGGGEAYLPLNYGEDLFQNMIYIKIGPKLSYFIVKDIHDMIAKQ